MTGDPRSLLNAGGRASSHWCALPTSVGRTVSIAAIVWAVSATTSPMAAQAVTPPLDTSAASVAARTGTLGADALRRRMSIDITNMRLRDALLNIARQAGIGIVQSDSVSVDPRTVTLHLKNATVREVLREALKGSGYRPTVSRTGMIVIARETDQDANELAGIVFGHIRDSATARPLGGALVTVRGMSRQVTSTDSGFYVLGRLPVGTHTLITRMLGYSPVERTVAVADGESVEANVALAMSMSRLQEVVTTATGQRRRLELGNDITMIDADSIVRTQPITSITDLLEARVPGLVVEHTTGAPGDPSRLRLRGAASAYRSNDPIVIVDGVRLYSAQSDSRSANLASPTLSPGGTTLTPAPAPSPLDQLDPNSIETIEVLKGPSAATLYGADAANGVIVITTKKGKAGPTRWWASIERGLSYMPGTYPEGYFRWGHNQTDNAPRWCPVTDLSCTADSTVRFQTLNDPTLTVLGNGSRSALTVGASGGSSALQYAVTGSASEDVGVLSLPTFAANAFQQAQGVAPPAWMLRPQDYKAYSGTSRLTAQIGQTADVSLTTEINRTDQQRSSLEGQLGTLMYTYVDPTTGMYSTATGAGFQPASQLLGNFYQLTTALATTFTNGLALNWRPRTWLNGSVDGGLQSIGREDEAVLPRDYSPTADSIGLFRHGSGSAMVSTLNVRATLTAPPAHGVTFGTSLGANFVNTRTDDIVVGFTDIPLGATSPSGVNSDSPGEIRSVATTYGVYVEPTVHTDRLYLSTGVRFDGGNSYGAHTTLAGFPKVGLSYLVSAEPFFPFKALFDQLRLRVAYGHAGVQPGPADRLRLYSPRAPANLDSQSVDITVLQSLGNVKLKPERSAELEGGFDADIANDRISASLTGYRKTREDALMQLPLPPSIFGEGISIFENIGVVRNSGVEATLGTEFLRSESVAWSAQLQLSRNRNEVVSLGPGVAPFNVASGGALTRIQAGYPLFGIWARPIVGYADANQNGSLERSEVQVGDSAVYMGAPTPNFEASLHTSVALFKRTLRLDVGFDYQNGLTQINATALDHQSATRALNDPSTPRGELAGTLVLMPQAYLSSPSAFTQGTTAYGIIQTVSTLRFNSLSISYALPTTVARWMGVRATSLSLQGTNLGLFTNYRGKDPNVNAYPVGNGLIDTGQLPAPRSWQLRVNVQ